MAKHIHKDQQFDRDYARDNLNDFFRALANGDTKEAEDLLNEVSGFMYAMLERESTRGEA
jgi:hypothetical protein